MAPDERVCAQPYVVNSASLMTEKIKHSLLKRIGTLRRSSSSFKSPTSESASSESSGRGQRRGTYPQLMTSNVTTSSVSKKVTQHRKSPLTHTRHGSLILSDPLTMAEPRKVASVPSMPDTAPNSTPVTSKKNAVNNPLNSPTSSKCSQFNTTSHSTGNAAVVKPSDRRSQHKFHKLFNMDQSQPLIKSFPCALVGDILFQGTFYASEHFFCFHSKFAKKRKLIQVAIREVTNLTREKTAGIIPNAIAVHTKHSRFMFASIIGRESIFRLLTNLWDTQLSMSNTMKWENNSPLCDTADLSVEPQSPNTNRISSKVWLTSASKTGTSQVSNDGVIHDSSVDTENESDDDDDADDEPVQINFSPSDDRSNGGVAKADLSPSRTPDPPSKPPGTAKSSGSSSYPRKSASGSLVRSRKHSTSSFSILNIGRSWRLVWSIPRMQLCLIIAYILLIFLAFSAIVLAWRVHTYQVLLHDRMEKLEVGNSEPQCHANDAQCNLYRLRQQTHSSRIRHVQAVMNSNIRTLNNLANRLRVSDSMVSQPVSSPEDKSETPPS